MERDTCNGSRQDDAPFSRVWSTAQGWARTLIREHLDGWTRQALFSACRESHDTVLREAAKVTFTIKLDEEKHQDMEAAMRSAAVLQQAINVRCARCDASTTAWPVTDLMLRDMTCWEATTLLQLLGDAAVHITELGLCSIAGINQAALTVVSRSCPRLQQLNMFCHVESLPTPSVFPRLTGLWLYDLESIASLQPYLPQLQSLHLSNNTLNCRQLCKALKPLPDDTLTKLTDLRLTLPFNRDAGDEDELDDALLEQLLRCAPALQSLTVTSVNLQSDKWAHRQTQLQSLAVNETITLSSLARLPSPPPGCRIELLAHFLVPDVEEPEQAAAVLHRAERITAFRNKHDMYITLKPVLINGVLLSPRKMEVAFDIVQSLGMADGLDPNDRQIRLHMPLTASGLNVLRHLPQWQNVEFCPPHFSSHPQVYNRLLRMLPPSYNHVFVKLPQDALDGPVQKDNAKRAIIQMVLGAPLHYSADTRLTIALRSNYAPNEDVEKLCQQVSDTIEIDFEPSNYEGVFLTC